MPVFRRAYVAIRKTEDREWLDLETINATTAGVTASINKTIRLIPTWDKDNPVVRTARVRIEEIEE